LALPKMPHQRANECRPAWPVLSRRHFRGQLGAGLSSTTFLGEPMPLIFGDDRLDHWQFEDLMSRRLGIFALQPQTDPVRSGRTDLESRRGDLM
jgi:hypothetical protein